MGRRKPESDVEISSLELGALPTSFADDAEMPDGTKSDLS
jgi:hypothetical protein